MYSNPLFRPCTLTATLSNTTLTDPHPRPIPPRALPPGHRIQLSTTGTARAPTNTVTPVMVAYHTLMDETSCTSSTSHIEPATSPGTRVIRGRMTKAEGSAPAPAPCRFGNAQVAQTLPGTGFSLYHEHSCTATSPDTCVISGYVMIKAEDSVPAQHWFSNALVIHGPRYGVGSTAQDTDVSIPPYPPDPPCFGFPFQPVALPASPLASAAA